MKTKLTLTIEEQIERAVAGYPYPREEITTSLFDTQWYIAGATTRMVFLRDVRAHIALSNLYMPGCLPSGQFFVVKSISVVGITSRLMFGAASLVIGSKHYGINPVLRYSLKSKGMKLEAPLLIRSQEHFYFTIDWQAPNTLGPGLDGKEQEKTPIQVTLEGQLFRPVQ